MPAGHNCKLSKSCLDDVSKMDQTNAIQCRNMTHIWPLSAYISILEASPNVLQHAATKARSLRPCCALLCDSNCRIEGSHAKLLHFNRSQDSQASHLWFMSLIQLFSLIESARRISLAEAKTGMTGSTSGSWVVRLLKSNVKVVGQCPKSCVAMIPQLAAIWSSTSATKHTLCCRADSTSSCYMLLQYVTVQKCTKTMSWGQPLLN